jgi:hypothetical protein
MLQVYGDSAHRDKGEEGRLLESLDPQFRVALLGRAILATSLGRQLPNEVFVVMVLAERK